MEGQKTTKRGKIKNKSSEREKGYNKEKLEREGCEKGGEREGGS